MKVFVWRGRDVLTDYGSGMIVVMAESLEQAWAKMRAQDQRAYWNLIGAHLYESEEEALDYKKEPWSPLRSIPVQPEIYDLNDMPVLRIWGS